MTNDLISREALLVVPNVRKVTEYDETGECITYLAVPEEAIKNVPAVDAVEVVRCKDCLHWLDGICGNFSNEDGSDYFTPAYGYCYAAEKEDSDEAD